MQTATTDDRDPESPTPAERLWRLTALVVAGRFDQLAELRRCADGPPDRRFREALLQTHLFAGFPRVVEALTVLAREGGIGEPGDDELLAEPDLPERGAELFERIYGEHAGRVRAALSGYHADFARWIEGHAYGRVLTRPGLEPRERELLAVAALIASDQDRQLASHVRGAIACGASPAEVEAVLATVVQAIALEPDVEQRARRVIARFAHA